MNMMSTLTAPAGARFGRPSASHLATVDTMLARAAAFGGGGRMMASASDTPPVDPAPAAPTTPADTAARLDAQDVQIADHETRIAGLEQRSPPPVADAGVQGDVAILVRRNRNVRRRDDQRHRDLRPHERPLDRAESCGSDPLRTSHDPDRFQPDRERPSHPRSK